VSRPPRAVTFDCWGTLIRECDPRGAEGDRIALVARAAARAGTGIPEERAAKAWRAAAAEHWRLWERHVATGAEEMSRWALEALGVRDGAAAAELAREVERTQLERGTVEIAGARETLERLAAGGVRRALVCDTGISPGRIVRELLAAHGLLELLEVQIFSNEAGVPKPDPRVFRAALAPLGVEPRDAVHVGDLKRTDIAGARGAGMRAVRIRQHYDDPSDHPEADWVCDTHAELAVWLGLE
jgi:FMN phosphatase YigB (HAD superfamily)